MKPMEQNSRDEFVRQVAKAIEDAQNDSERTESFIFGLSAKWGEGKTTFLNDLKARLNDSIVVEINPWKYSDNKVTFLQSFLIALLDLSNIESKDSVRDEILMTKTENRIEMKKGKWWLILIAVAFVVSVILNLLPQLIPSLPNWVISVFQFTGTIAVIPWMMNHFEQMASSTVTDKTTSALIAFDATLTTILLSYRKHIVIYVDDLDRVSAKNAVLVLDNLRTFFDRKELSFIVSGDHSVMERHIGNELLPDGKSEERLEEGRRYLKKIFNIYWRMPIPTDAEIENYISDTMAQRLTDVGLNGVETSQLTELLNSLFENNYRNIERMASQIAFTLHIVKGKNDASENDETRIYYEDLLSHKMLLIKVLLIQELANPYYEYLLKESDYLRLSDKSQEIQPKDKDTAGPTLTDGQRKNLEILLKAEPRFHNENGLVVYDMKPFIYLSADSNFGDHRGLLPSEFHARLTALLSDKDEFEKLLQQHSVEMLRKGVAAMAKERTTAADKTSVSTSQSLSMAEMAQELITLINCLNKLDSDYSAQKQEFKTYFDPEVITQYAGLNSSEYAEMVFALGELYQGDIVYSDSLANCTDMITAPQFLLLIQYANDEGVNPVFESILWRCFENLGIQNLNAFITQFGSIVDKLGEHALPDKVLSVLVGRIKPNYLDETAKTVAKLIKSSRKTQYIDDAIRKIKTLLSQQQPLLIEILRILDAENYEDYVLEFIDEASDYQELCKRMQFAAAGGLGKDDVWHHVIDNDFEILVTNTARLLPNPRLASPSSVQAKHLAQKVVRYAKDNRQNSLLSNIDQRAYPFENLDSIKGDAVVTKYLNGLKESGDKINSANAKRLLSMGEEGE